MSYCRFSSENFMCDVYVYADCGGGWTTHVAGNRYAFPPLPPFRLGWLIRWLDMKADPGVLGVRYPTRAKRIIGDSYFWLYAKWERARRFSLDRIPRRRIELPHAGERFNDDSAGECADRLESLRKLGYRVPQYAIDALRDDERDGTLQGEAP